MLDLVASLDGKRLKMYIMSMREVVERYKAIAGNYLNMQSLLRRTCRLLMNLLQMEFDVLPTKVLKEDKVEYIQALIDTREHEENNIFIDCMTRLHCQHLKADIDHYIESTSERMVDKQALRQKLVDKWSIKPSLAEKLVDILEYVADRSATTGDACQSKKDEFTTEQIVSHFGFNATTAKRYLRQLSEFGYLEPRGGNKNRTYSRILGSFRSTE